MGIVRTLSVPRPSPWDLFKTEVDPVHCGRVCLPEKRRNIQYPQMHGTSAPHNCTQELQNIFSIYH